MRLRFKGTLAFDYNERVVYRVYSYITSAWCFGVREFLMLCEHMLYGNTPAKLRKNFAKTIRRDIQDMLKY